MIYRHGDLLLVPKSLPKKISKILEGKSFVLAEGETTGHKHLLTAPHLEIYQNDDTGERYVKLSQGGTITHEEHKTIKVEPQTYIVVHEREHDYFSEETRRVLD